MTPSEASTTKRGVVFVNDFRSLVWKSQQLHSTFEWFQIPGMEESAATQDIGISGQNEDGIHQEIE